MRAYAKINLFLRIVGKKPNGYHELQMINTRINLYDVIKIKKTKTCDQVIYINESIDSSFDSLVIRTIKTIKQFYHINSNYKITIVKHIPLGAGLGGGSMDAACIAKSILKKEKINYNIKDLINLLLPLGADIPYGLYNNPCIVEGIGEVISPIRINKRKYILLYPNINMETKNVFSNVEIIKPKLAFKQLIEKVNLDENENDLQNVALKLNEKLRYIYNEIKIPTFMSGSGSTLIIKYNKKEYKKLKKQYPKFKIKIVKTIEGKENE